MPNPPRDFHAIGSQNATKIKPPCVFVRRRSFESLERWVTTWTPVRNQLMTLTKSVWHMCGRLVGGVGPKMKTCNLLRVKQRLAFCCPLLPNKLFSVFCDIVFLPGVFTFAFSTGETTFSTHLCGECVEECLNCNFGRQMRARNQSRRPSFQDNFTLSTLMSSTVFSTRLNYRCWSSICTRSLSIQFLFF